MIQKMTSKDIMNILTRAEDSVSEMQTDILLTKNQLEERLAVIQNSQNFLLQQALLLRSDINEGHNKSCDKLVFADADIQEGVYDLFGMTICPKSIKRSIDVFNLATETGVFFKNNVTVKINDNVSDKFKNMLMSDYVLGKDIAFEEFDDPTISIEIEINPDDLLGSTAFNTIELVPYIPGSFNLQQIDVYDMQGRNSETLFPVLSIRRTIQDVAAMRILIDKTRDLYKLNLNFKLNYLNPDGKYPFGIKHLYLTKENYNTESYVVVKMTNPNYIRSIGENLIVSDQNGVYESTIQEEGITLYTNYINGILDHEIDISHGYNEKILSRNIKEFYARLPIDRTIISIKFSEIRTKRHWTF